MSKISKNGENIACFASSDMSYSDMSYLKIVNYIIFSTNCGRKVCELLPLARNYRRKDCEFSQNSQS